MKEMRSDGVKKGTARAPHRSLFRAMGWTDEEMARPLVGVCSAKNEIIPGHVHLDKIAEAVKAGIRLAGGTPVEFNVIGVCDGIAMGHEGMKYSLVTRELIADSIECMVTAHQFDAVVMVPNCDKIVPGMVMAAARLDLPTVIVSGGPMMAGKLPGKDKRLCLSDMFEAVGAYGKTVTALDGIYRTQGIQDVTLRLYPDGRHEMLSEVNKEQVICDILAWIEKRIA
jgi:dihydroxy-acid dehydratase